MDIGDDVWISLFPDQQVFDFMGDYPRILGGFGIFFQDNGICYR